MAQGEDASEGSSLDLLRAGIAVLDRDGTVSWADAAWQRWTEESGGVLAADVGVDLLAIARGRAEPAGEAIAAGISAVIGGAASFFELEYAPPFVGGNPVLLSVARMDDGRVVVIQRLIGERRAPAGVPFASGSSATGQPAGDASRRLTPREAEVLNLMANGLDNRAIAQRLGIAYTTVRGHVREIIGKLGARSRLQAVARAYQMGLVG